jgi:preprotein translocase subunit SecB
MNDKQEAKKQFAIQKLYIKDASFESPGAPESFSFAKWEPKIDLNLTNDQKHVEGDLYEVVVNVTVTVSVGGTAAFLVEVQQAGLFAIAGFDDRERKYLLGSQCMSILFPYLREAVTDLSVRGGFPPLVLTPVNFDALYHQHLQQQQQAQQGEAAEAAPGAH